ncbi:hypothetical protein CHL67_05830 [Prosthecochloris sp. GSB1]|uniref:FixH family protein n=1 Tax=Prosthecochloris sp. GSB1 TaxID=281093 RepID=UPI000B8C9945|nr:FixH family protein [Prosthecochloris sp. GSB1]ASQ91662.1 hypothetical protein CHL67_05830 [Prosthecochloris sp. GSB1]
MKAFLYILYAVFLFAMGMGFYVAYRGAEELVEDNYYEKASAYFETREREDSLGMRIELPEGFRKGENRAEVRLSMQGEPLVGADVRLIACGMPDGRGDTAFGMVETEPGVYRTDLLMPFRGTCLMKVEVTTPTIKTGRKWFTEIE